MPFYHQRQSFSQRFRVALSSFMQHDGLPFTDVLTEEKIQHAFDDEHVSFAQGDDDVYTPAITLWAFLSQVLFKNEQRSCLAAVSRIVVLWVALGKEPCSDNTGAYCRARAKLPVVVIKRLALTVSHGCEQKLPTSWLWKGRHVHLVDGTTVSMPDTSENQKDYPQPTTQAKGLGFPQARMVVLLSLASAMITGMDLGPCAGKETGENALLRQLFDFLQAGDILLGDRYYCSYFLIALLMERGVDVVTRLHQAREADFRRGQRLGAGDHVVTWTRPAKPEWMDQSTYDRMPLSIQVREIQVQVHQPGFRVESFVAVTTLTAAEAYTKEDVGELYHERWLVELDIRAIKVGLGMEVLRCKTPEMVRREIWTCLLAYNLIRQTLLQAALAAGRSPRQLSFTAALQKIAASWATLAVCDETMARRLVAAHLSHLARHIVGDRPGRVEPRAIKRRPKPQRLLTQPRAQARAELLTGMSA
jgi:putative transposase